MSSKPASTVTLFLQDYTYSKKATPPINVTPFGFMGPIHSNYHSVLRVFFVCFLFGLHIDLCTKCLPAAYGGQRKAPNSLGLEELAVETAMWVLGAKPASSAPARALNANSQYRPPLLLANFISHPSPNIQELCLMLGAEFPQQAGSQAFGKYAITTW